MTTEAQLSKTLNIQNLRYRSFHSCNHQQCVFLQILGGKAIKNVQIDPQTTIYHEKAKSFE